MGLCSYSYCEVDVPLDTSDISPEEATRTHKTRLSQMYYTGNANCESNHRRNERICIHVAMPNNKICIPSVRLFLKVKIQQSFMEHSTFINE